MNKFTYDVECFAHDFIVVFKEKETGTYSVFHNDNIGVKEFIGDDLYFSFNGKHYDKYMIQGISAGLSPQELKELNDWIIGGEQGWLHPYLKGTYFKFNNIDLKDDVQKGLSLKSIACHLGLSVLESNVPFDIERPLTQEEIVDVVKYCKSDVDVAENLIDVRVDYLKTKLNLGKRVNIDTVKALSCTNAKLTALMLGATRKEWSDGREYVYPSNVDKSLIPDEVLSFFDTIHDMSMPDDKLFKTSCTIDLGGMKTKYAWGGVHGSLTGYFEQTTDTRIVQNRDVSSLYPSLIEEYQYLSRNVPNPEIFYNIKRERIEAKHNGDKQVAKDLKLPLNTVSGAQENRFNDLYDPLPTRSLRISGQLFLTMLAVRLLNECETIKLINFNTDGLMYSVDRTELEKVDIISAEWEKSTRFELETDEIDRVWVKDVNNLLMVKEDGKVKTVGGYLNYGISVKGAWAINNNATIVKKALKEYFVNETPVEDTINDCNDILEFQLIAKAGTMYRELYHSIGEEQIPVQRVNRVYASKDKSYGKLFKVKAETDSVAKIASLPDHCIIDNDNVLSINDVDKTWYIELTKKRIDDFLGIKPKRKTRRKKQMATTKKNIYQKLLEARLMFSQEEVKKTGKNMHLSFKYFDLEDIVPIANKIFSKIGIIPIVTFEGQEKEFAIMKVVNTENPDEQIVFEAPFNKLEPIVSNTGKQATNTMQALGSSITYMRRYLYMIALDICESDDVDANLGKPSTASPKTAPATPQERTETKSELTNSNGNASALQIKQLKTALKKLKDAQPEKEEYIAKIAVDTKSFTEISKVDCEKMLTGISKLLGGAA